MVLTAEDNLAIATTGIVSITLSICGNIGVISLFFLLSNRRTFRNRLILFLSISDLFWITSTLCGLVWFKINVSPSSTNTPQPPNAFCQVTGFFLQWFIISTDFWIAAISIYMYLFIIKNKIDIQKNEWIFHVVCWGVPLLIALVPFIPGAGSYGLAGTWY